jgi:hypothetical protein
MVTKGRKSLKYYDIFGLIGYKLKMILQLQDALSCTAAYGNDGDTGWNKNGSGLIPSSGGNLSLLRRACD